MTPYVPYYAQVLNIASLKAPMDKIKGRLILKVMIPEHCCSAVIGPKGAHSKKIREVR